MRNLQEHDFDKMAARVVDRFMNGEKLADAATSEAMGGELNPDQIARLVQAANTQAFLQLMEQQKAQGGHDMTSEFDPIDARQVIQQLIGQTPQPHEEMPQMHPDMGAGPGMEDAADAGPLPDEMGAHRPPPAFANGGPSDSVVGDETGDEVDDNDGPFPKGEKQKAKDDADKKSKPKKDDKSKDTDKSKTKEAAFRSRRLSKLADILEDQYKQAEWAFEDTFANLERQLRRAHGAPTAAAFEKDALALYGNDEIGVVVLNMVKQAQGLNPVSADDVATKTAALADRHLVDDTETNKTFAALVKIAVEANRLRLGAAHARAQCS